LLRSPLVRLLAPSAVACGPHTRPSSWARWLAGAALLVACGSDGDEAPGADAATDAGGTTDGGTSDAGTGASSDASAGDAGALEQIDGEVGTFSVRVVQPVAASGSTSASPGHIAVSGKVYDGLPTPTLIWQEASTVGACALLKPKAPYCEGGCASGFTCVDDDVCQRSPSPRDVGAVTLSGVKTTSGATTAKLTSILGSYGPDTGVSFDYPGFAEGDGIELAAAGASPIAAFTITAKGVAPLALTGTSYKLDRAQKLALAWTAAGDDAGTRIKVRLDISHHGGARGLITCDAPDTGSLDVDAALVAGLLDLGVAGYPTIVVTRENVGTADIGAGRVALNVYSDVEQAVEIDGLTSCTSDSDCGAGKTCQTDLTCQ
jgi:hypothetical protein